MYVMGIYKSLGEKKKQIYTRLIVLRVDVVQSGHPPHLTEM